jgi:hypothetical protein
VASAYTVRPVEGGTAELEAAPVHIDAVIEQSLTEKHRYQASKI